MKMNALKQLLTRNTPVVICLVIYINMVNSEVMANNLVNISLSEKYVAVGNQFNVTCHSSRKTYKLRIDQGINLITIMYTDDSGKFILKPDMRFEKSRFRAAFPNKLNRTQDFVSITFVSEPAETDFSGDYACYGTDEDNKNEQRSSLVKLFIGYKPQKMNFTVTVNGKKKYVFYENDELKVKCNTRIVDNTNGSLELFDSSISDKSVKPVVKQEIYAIEKTLYMVEPVLYDGKIIKCVAKNVYGTVEQEVILKVKYKPREKLIFANNEVASEILLTPCENITCSAKGNPKLDVEWVVYDKSVFKKVQGMSNVLVSEEIQKEFAKFTLECRVIQNETDTIVTKQFVVTLRGKLNLSLLKFRIIGNFIYFTSILIFSFYAFFGSSYIGKRICVGSGRGRILFLFAFFALMIFAPLVLLFLICNCIYKKIGTCCQCVQKSPNAGYESAASKGETDVVVDRTNDGESEIFFPKHEELQNKNNELENINNIVLVEADVTLKEELDETESQNKNLQLEIDEKESEIKNLILERDEKDDLVLRLNRQLSEKEASDSELKVQLETAVAERDILQKRINKLEEENIPALIWLYLGPAVPVEHDDPSKVVTQPGHIMVAEVD